MMIRISMYVLCRATTQYNCTTNCKCASKSYFFLVSILLFVLMNHKDYFKIDVKLPLSSENGPLNATRILITLC